MKIKRIIVAAAVVLTSVGIGLIPAAAKDITCCGSEGVWAKKMSSQTSSIL